MTVKNFSSIALFAGLALTTVGCTGDDTSATGTGTVPATTGGPGGGSGATVAATDDGGSDTAGQVDESGSGGGECPGVGGAAADGEDCTANSDCASGVCLLWADVPPSAGSVCGESSPDCFTRISGTTFDFATGGRAPGLSVRVADAIQAALNPAGAAAIVMGDSNAEAQFDQTSTELVTSGLGIVSLVEGGDYFLTISGVSAPNDAGSYDVGVGLHEMWAMPSATLTTWSGGLAMDATIPAENLPLGDNGGVVGLTRDGTTGAAMAGVTVVSVADDSTAIIRYLGDDGTWGTAGTESAGVFVVITPGLGEAFTGQIGGATVTEEGRAGSATGAIFTLIMNVTP